MLFEPWGADWVRNVPRLRFYVRSLNCGNRLTMPNTYGFPAATLVTRTHFHLTLYARWFYYRGADKSLARPTSRCIFFDGENISFDASLVIYINSNTIHPTMIT